MWKSIIWLLQGGGTSEAIMQLLTVHAGTQKKPRHLRCGRIYHAIYSVVLAKIYLHVVDYLDPVGVNSMGDLQDPIHGGT